MSLLKAALLLMASAWIVVCVNAQLLARPGGALSGRLTDLHSAPLENFTVILRHAATGAQVQTTTARGGRYVFTGLIEGEYILTATGPQGAGTINGIFVSAGHQARIQTALDISSPHHEVVANRRDSEPGTTPASEPAGLPPSALRALRLPLPTPMDTKGNTISLLPANPLLLLTLSETRPPMPASKPSAALEPAVPVQPATRATEATRSSADSQLEAKLSPRSLLPAFVSPLAAASFSAVAVGDLVHATLAVEIPQLSLLSLDMNGAAQAVFIEKPTVAATSQSLDAAQLQSLPLRGRDWQSFLHALPQQGSDEGDQQRLPATPGANTGMTLDGMRAQLAFGDTGQSPSRRSGSSLIGPVSTDAAIRTIHIAETSADDAAQGSMRVETQRGTEHLHGTAFVFDRANLWNARNPFTAWVKEVKPGSLATLPVFTPEPYTPGDLEALWGGGLGGVFDKRLYWFFSLEGYQRNHPAISTVKHPENFFAQPSNDQMQLLSAQLGIGAADPVSAGLTAYTKLLENLTGLLGPSPRSASQQTGFARGDWKAGERQRFTLEASVANHDAPGGGLTRASATYGTHSFGTINEARQWTLGKWEAFLTPNLLAATRFSYGHQRHSSGPETPSAFEQALNINAWNQLPQIVVDSRYGFTIGNPARLAKGDYPDERSYNAQEQFNWVHGDLLFHAGVEYSHNRDATTRLRNQIGTYHYSTIEDFASDALSFSSFGLSGQLNPLDQHNCDQTGRAWRDASGVLRGLGYLPCYSYYSQTMGPSSWWLSTDDWAGYVTSQWQPAKSLVATLAMRWEIQQLPGPIASLQNLDLPLTAHTPQLGNQWGPRAGLAWGTGESHWPVMRLGYGMYFARTRNSVLESVLTQTGSPQGDLNFFMRPTDNLHAGGAPPFPYVLAGEPARVVKPAATEFAPGFRNGEIHQAEASIEETAPGRIHIEASAVASLARRLPVTFDANIDPSDSSKTITYAVVDGNGSGPLKSPQITVPFFASWPSVTSPTGFAGRLNPNYQQVSEIYSRANSTYEAAILRISRNARAVTLHGRYTYAHAMDWNPDETSQLSGPTVFDPIDFRQEYGTSSLDVRHSATAAVILRSPWKLTNLPGHLANGWMLSGTGYFRSGLPYTMRTGGGLAREFNTSRTAIVALSTGMNGYGGDNRVYGIGRNTYRYPQTWKADLRLGKRFDLGQLRQLELMAESFNLFNHQNVTELETTGYTIESGSENGALPRLNFLTGLKTGQTEFGKPLNINATDFYRERQVQFGARLHF